MRVPHVIDLNTRTAYQPSEEDIKFLGETNRKIVPDDFLWMRSQCSSLVTCCVKTISSNFENKPVFFELPSVAKEYLLEILSVHLPLHLTIPLIEDEIYWNRCYSEKYGIAIERKHIGWTWKCLYLERYIRDMCEKAEPQYKDENNFKDTLKLLAPYIHIFTVKELQHWKPPLNWEPENIPVVHPTFHINFIPILRFLPYVTEIEISFGMHNVGLAVERHMFKLDPCDCENLGKAVNYLKHVRILKVCRSDVKCEHVKALMRKLVENRTLIELNLSYCKIGNMGAKCIGAFLTIHEKLKVLNLRGNLIGPEGAKGLAFALIHPSGTNLCRLDLGLNPILHEGVIVIGSALIRGTLLQELILRGCDIKGQTAMRLGDMLKANFNLKYLDVSGNDLGQHGGRAIADSLQTNLSLIDLDIRFTGIPEETELQIKEATKRNLMIALEQMKNESHFDSIDSIYSNLRFSPQSAVFSKYALTN